MGVMVIQRFVLCGPSPQVAKNVIGTATRVALRGAVWYRVMLFRVCGRSCDAPRAHVIWWLCDFLLCLVPLDFHSLCSVEIGAPRVNM